MNVQVVVQKSAEGTNLILRDVEGQFLEAKPLEEAMPEGGSGEDTRVETLWEALQTMGEERNALQEQVSALRAELESMKMIHS